MIELLQARNLTATPVSWWFVVLVAAVAIAAVWWWAMAGNRRRLIGGNRGDGEREGDQEKR